MKKKHKRIYKTRSAVITTKHIVIIVIIGIVAASAVAFMVTRGIGWLWGSGVFNN